MEHLIEYAHMLYEKGTIIINDTSWLGIQVQVS